MGVPEFYNYSAIGIESNGEPVAGVVYHNYYPVFKDVEMSVAITNPIAAHPDIIAGMFRYPFEQMGCNRITVGVSANNKRSIRFIEGIGFVQEGRQADGCGDSDRLMYGLTRKNAQKWLTRRKR